MTRKRIRIMGGIAPPLLKRGNLMPLDKSRPYGTVHGDLEGRHFSQDGKYFDASGEEIPDKVIKTQKELPLAPDKTKASGGKI